jgi:hypothetical protein
MASSKKKFDIDSTDTDDVSDPVSGSADTAPSPATTKSAPGWYVAMNGELVSGPHRLYDTALKAGLDMRKASQSEGAGMTVVEVT